METYSDTMFTKAHASDRPRRGRPDETRRRLVRAAAETFNANGYAGTDVRRIVEAAGYSTGSFYKHFTDKGEVLLAAYQTWVVEEWEALGAAILTPGGAHERAERIVAISADLHSRWHGLRQSMASYKQVDDAAALAFVELQRRQLAMLRELRAAIGPDEPIRPVEADVLLVMLIERAVEGMAWGEPAALGLDEATMRRLLVSAVAEALG